MKKGDRVTVISEYMDRRTSSNNGRIGTLCSDPEFALEYPYNVEFPDGDCDVFYEVALVDEQGSIEKGIDKSKLLAAAKQAIADGMDPDGIKELLAAVGVEYTTGEYVFTVRIPEERILDNIRSSDSDIESKRIIRAFERVIDRDVVSDWITYDYTVGG